MSKLTDIQIEEVCTKYKEGLSIFKIAPLFKVHPTAIWYHIRKHNIVIREPCEVSRKYTLNVNVFDTITEESAYWIGFLMADGNIYKSRISLGLQNRDKKHILKFNTFLQSNYPIRNEKNNQSRVYIFSKKLAIALAKYNVIPRKSFITTAHPILENNYHFWRGVIDGDGGIGINGGRGMPYLELCGSYTLMNQFNTFIKKLNPNSMTNIIPFKSIYRVRLFGKYAKNTIEILYNQCSIALARKLDIANKIIQLIGIKPLPQIL